MRKKLECVGKMLGPRLASFFIAHPLVRKELECVGDILGLWLASFVYLTHWLERKLSVLKRCWASGLPVLYGSPTD